MPKFRSEKLRYHEKPHHFFYILSGTATFEIDGRVFDISEIKAIHIKPGVKHKIMNNGDNVLEFLVIPRHESHNDRINLE